MTADVYEFRRIPPQHGASDGGGGNGKDSNGRDSSIEAKLDNLATKEDVKIVEKVILEREASMQRWLIGIFIVSIVAMLSAFGSTVVALARAFS